jgi:DNA-binding beta-propeller fold protein YncE
LNPGDVIASFNDAPASIAKIDPRSGAIEVIATGDHIKDPWEVEVTPLGRIIVAEFVDHSIISIDPRTGAQTVVSTEGGFRPVGVGLASNGNLIASDSVTPARVVSVNPSTGAITPISTGGVLGAPSGIAVAPSGRIYVADEGTNPGVYAINPGTGAQTPVATTGVQAPFAVALGANGRVLFADYNGLEPPENGAIFSVSPAGGPLTTISSGNLFGDPIGLARSFRGPLIVAEQDRPEPDGSIIKVNPGNGAQQTLALASAAGLAAPGAVAVVPPRCFGRFATIVGSPKADQLRGTRFPDVIAGAGGNDRIKGLGRGDRLCGGKGRDRVLGGKGRDRLQGGPVATGCSAARAAIAFGGDRGAT